MTTIVGTDADTTAVTTAQFTGLQPADDFPPFTTVASPTPPPPPPSTDLRAWFKADVYAVRGADDIVSGWTDQSGSGNNATVTDTFVGPRYDAGVINGLPGLNSFYDPMVSMGGTAPNLPDASPYHIVAVVHTAPADAPPQPAGFTIGGGLLNIGTGVIVVFGVYGGDLYISPTVTATGVILANDTSYLFEMTSDGVTQRAFVNGTELTLADTTPMVIAGNDWFLFDDFEGGQASFWGWTSEVLVYKSIQAGADLTHLRAYILSRYGL